MDQLVSSETEGLTTTYSYDLRGNLTQTASPTGTTTYAWDALDRLTGTTLPDASQVLNTYDADGHRVVQSIDGEVTNFLWDTMSPYGDVVLEYNASGNPVVDYVLGGTRLISQTQSSDTSYYLQDGQRSTRALTNQLGIATDSYTYDAFGELIASTGTTANKYLYTGQQFDAATGLYSLRARHYSPTVGRFLSQDVWPYNFQNPMELNRYGYVAGNAVNWVDPTGNMVGSAILTSNLGVFANVSLPTFAVSTGALYAIIAGIVTGVALSGLYLLAKDDDLAARTLARLAASQADKLAQYSGGGNNGGDNWVKRLIRLLEQLESKIYDSIGKLNNNEYFKLFNTLMAYVLGFVGVALSALGVAITLIGTDKSIQITEGIYRGIIIVLENSISSTFSG